MSESLVRNGTYGTYKHTAGEYYGIKQSDLFVLDGADNGKTPHLILNSSTLREAVFYKILSHPYIVECEKIMLNSTGEIHIMIEHCPCDMINVFTRENRMENFAKYFAHVAYALRFMHESGMCHGDIKPANIVISRRGRAKLIDFGSVQFYYGKYNKALTTYMFASPEDLLYKVYGPTNDIWALGITMITYIEGRYRDGTIFNTDEEAVEYYKTNADKSIVVPDCGAYTDILTHMLDKDHTRRATIPEILKILDPDGAYDRPGKLSKIIESPDPVYVSRGFSTDLAVSLLNRYIDQCQSTGGLEYRLCYYIQVNLTDPHYFDIPIKDYGGKDYLYDEEFIKSTGLYKNINDSNTDHNTILETFENQFKKFQINMRDIKNFIKPDINVMKCLDFIQCDNLYDIAYQYSTIFDLDKVNYDMCTHIIKNPRKCCYNLQESIKNNHHTCIYKYLDETSLSDICKDMNLIKLVIRRNIDQQFGDNI